MQRKIITGLFFLLLGVRPFLSSLVLPKEDIAYSFLLIVTCLLLLGKDILAWRKNPLFFYFILWLGALLLSVIFSKNFENSLSQFYKYAAYTAVFFTVCALGKDKKKVILIVLLTSCSLLSFYALRWFLYGTLYTIDYLTRHHSSWDFAFEYLSRGRAFFPFVTPAALGGYLILFAPLSIAFLFAKNQTARPLDFSLSVKNILNLLAVISITLALLATQSLGAIFSLLLATAVLIFRRRRNMKMSLLLWIVLPFAIFLPFLFILRNSNAHFFNLPSFSLANRFSYWEHAMGLIIQHPLVGLGPGNYPFFKSISPHNSYLQVWAETGIFGLTALISIFYRVLKVDFAAKAGSERIIYESLWIGNLAFIIHNLADLTLFLPEIFLLWWVNAALMNTAGESVSLKNDRGL